MSEPEIDITVLQQIEIDTLCERIGEMEAYEKALRTDNAALLLLARSAVECLRGLLYQDGTDAAIKKAERSMYGFERQLAAEHPGVATFWTCPSCGAMFPATRNEASRCSSCVVIEELQQQRDAARDETAGYKAATDDAHAILTTIGIPLADRVACDDPACQTKLGHRMRALVARFQAASALAANIESLFSGANVGVGAATAQAGAGVEGAK